MLKVVSLDDHPVFGMGLKLALQNISADIEVEATTSSQDAIRYIQQHPDIDVLLLDLNMPIVNGLTIMRSLQALDIIVPIVILTADDDLSMLQDAISLRCVGIIPKTFSPTQILEALRTVVAGEMFIPRSIELSLKLLGKFSVDNTESMLSKRQLEILKMLQSGLSNKAIANALFISELTVKSHFRTIFKLLGVSNRTECLKKAEKYQII